MPTTDELNAAFDAVTPDLHALALQFVPGFFLSRAEAALTSADGRTAVLKLVKDALTAAEKVRGKNG